MLVGGPPGGSLVSGRARNPGACRSNHSKAGEAAAFLYETAPADRASRISRREGQLAGNRCTFRPARRQRNNDGGTARCTRKDTSVPGRDTWARSEQIQLAASFSRILEFLRMVYFCSCAPKSTQPANVGNWAKSTKRCSKFAEVEELAKHGQNGRPVVFCG